MLIGKIFRVGRASLHGLALLAAIASSLPVLAQQAPAETPKVDAPKAEAPKTETPKAEAPKEAAPAQNVAPADHAAAPASEDTIKTTEVAAQVVIETRGSASWEEGYAKIGEALAKLRAAAQKAGLKENGRPQTVFTDTDDAGFKFEAMLPVESPADAKPTLGPDIVLTQSPSGKAIKFQHRGAYDDIDSTYEAITAYLDEKGLEARNLFVEEYLNDAKDSTDMALQVDIYVFLK